MFGPLKTLFDRQRRRAEEDADLVSRLDPSRTVLLEDLIADVKRPERLALLGAPWLDAGRFTSRIASACAWLDRIPAEPRKGWQGMPLYFFQAASAEEDEAAHRAMLALEAGEPEPFRRYTAIFAGLPTAAQYLPIHTKVCTLMEGRYADRDLRLRPLFSTFSTYGQACILDGEGCHAVNGRLVAYRVPDFAALLDVSSAVATDFFARVVVHDLCHAYLPDTPNAAEGFHNVASIVAMGTLPPPVRYKDLWEGFIHAECTDPAFCLRARDELMAMRKALGTPAPVEADILDGYRKWYVHPKALEKRRAWNLPEGALPKDLLARIEEARQDGFRLYARLMVDP